ncbi:MAG: cytochrome d ubiquinol oxidase subunit II [Phycisphaeraceae bacterium]|nr:MAG: cytochrome d ubiquinol oxidase subunit II [Phycisphaeraceae bacterium]
MSHDALSLIWFALLGVLLIGYTILDGFDLGVGILHPIARTDEDRRIMMNSIGPIWDGNEVWLVTFGGALFAAFPDAYATIFSGFYIAFMLLLLALICRAVSLEFRSKVTSRLWRGVWDTGFFASSFLAAFLFGVAGGNVMLGLPVDAEYVVHQSVFQQLSPYPLAVGGLTVLLFAMHGAIFLYLKTEGDLQQRVERWIWRAFGFFLIAYILITMFTLVAVPRATTNFKEHPWLWIVPVLNVLAIANIPRAMHLRRPGYAFLSSCATIAALALLLGVALFPNLVPSSIDPEHSLTVFNARSSEKTLKIMLTIAVIGMPCVLAYTTVIYWVFRGKVKLDHASY